MAKIRQKSRKRISVFKFAQRQIDRLIDNNRIGTAKTYTATLNSFRRFRNGADLYFGDMDSAMIEEYEASLVNNGLIRNTTSFYMRTLRTIYNLAVEQRLTADNNVFRHVYTGFDKTCKRAIPTNCIKMIKRLNLSSTPSLAFARDVFLFSFYTRGMSFIDIAYLKKSDLKNGFITYRRKKTGRWLTIEWEQQMQDIVNQYNHLTADSPYILPIIKNMNSDNRRQYELMERNINRNLKKVALKAGLDISLTMYVARHSWASLARNLNIPMAIISEGMGHDSEKTTRIYLATLDTSLIDNANKKILKQL